MSRPSIFVQRTLRSIVAAGGALALVAACNGDDDAAGETETDPEAEEEVEDDPADEEAEAQTDDGDDFIRILANHEPEQDGDPVTVEFRDFEVTSVSFDPDDLEGGDAELEIDLSSLDSDEDDRDEHLRSPDYLNVEEHPTAVVAIGDVEHLEDDRYEASADVTVHGVEVTWPLELEVVERDGDTLRVRGEHSFDRMEFEVGEEEAGEDADPVAREMVLEAELTVSADM